MYSEPTQRLESLSTRPQNTSKMLSLARKTKLEFVYGLIHKNRKLVKTDSKNDYKVQRKSNVNRREFSQFY